jgi:hypothetical protein
LIGDDQALRNYDFPYLNQPRDVSIEFAKEENTHFVASRVESFDQQAASGTMRWERYTLRQRMSFNQVTPLFERTSWAGNGESFE